MNRDLAFHQQVRRFKVALLTETLLAHQGKKAASARALGLHPTYFWRLVRKYEIVLPERHR